MDQEYDLRVIGLGAGVQSSVMYIMAAEGELGPMPDFAVFADPQAELAHTYEWLDWLEEGWGHIIPIHRVTRGSLLRNLYHGGEGRKGFAQIPAYVETTDRIGRISRGIGRRGCTYQFKIRPIQDFIREQLGLTKGQRAKGRFRVQQWMGITLDEAQRAKPSDVDWIDRHYPLMFDAQMRRGDCLRYMADRGLPLPRKSACFFCPYHRDPEWAEVRDQYPEQWKQSVQLDEDLRSGQMRASEGLNGRQFLHDSLIPLKDVDLDAGRDQPDLFGNECEGHCGV